MLGIKDVKYGLIPFGPGVGQRAILIDFSSNELINVDPELKDSLSLHSSLKVRLKIEKLEKEWTSAIDGSQSTFVVFRGGEIEKEENFDEWDKFNRAFSKESINVQTSLKLRPDQLRPPFCVWVGEPKEFTSKRNFYQYFNCVYAVIESKYNQMALQEILNHQFSSICLLEHNKIKSTLKELNKLYKLSHKLTLVEKVDGEEIPKLCLANGYKYNYYYKGEQFLALI